MAGKSEPTVRDRQVGIRLRGLREARKTTIEKLAAASGLSESTLQRIEAGKRRVSTEEVAVVTTALKVTPADRQELIEFARSGDKGGWWEKPLPGVPQEMGLLASYEAEAESVIDWSVMLIPGLLQIEPYARAYMTNAEAPPDEADLRWVARRRRQDILGRFDYTAYIYEGALRVPFGGREVFREQIKHLIACPDRGIAVRLVREKRPVSMLLHSWHYMTFPSVGPVVNVEVSSGGVYLQDEHVQEYTQQVKMLERDAVSRAESRAVLRALLKEI
jgi:transcriptional regulator with XRE-family HTH domain